MNKLEQLCKHPAISGSGAVEQAKSGHPKRTWCGANGVSLWDNFICHNPVTLHGLIGRFLLSAGHGSALLYALLHMTGYNLSLEELKHFRQWEK